MQLHMLVWCKKIIDVFINPTDPIFCPWSWKFYVLCAPCQILWKSAKPLRKNDRFSIFKMAAVRHFGFLKVGNFNCSYP